ncbi:MAG TPA: phosphoribosylaminoimidazolecarboxamide formyltransferase [Candidatus Scatomorpha intestinigallinarum]|uniref:Phosphoribosylaminoimidazolecarboxamide formyltransferase n=1 Tax=Candidatus Scatomorpha intestinigallinarum TaxID=2840923 RepID=A0A9D1DLC5_9FIRM|nr:phosphoribosylaminoimidazolecarboxamide formyltransferase [Candidatus Scatomorpha intestinigallinarum]
MREIELKYGCNPNQKPARIYMEDGSELPVEVLNGRPGYINFMDALNSWQLVRALRRATGRPAAASFKHVSPAGAAIASPLTDEDRRAFFAEGELSPVATAYARARGADRLCSYGDWAALSDTCDETAARLLLPEVSDGVIAPGYTPAALELLRQKRKGGYNVVRIDPDYEPAPQERRDIFGIRFEQGYNALPLTRDCLKNVVTANKTLTPAQEDDLLLALITLKYTQSNSVCYVKDGQTVGVGAGQQSRINCTRLAGDKADTWRLRRHPKVLELGFPEGMKRAERDNEIDRFIREELSEAEKRDWLSRSAGLALGSDAFFPFGDNIERAARSGVVCVAQPGGSIRDDNVIETADKYGMVMCFTGIRLFHH